MEKKVQIGMLCEIYGNLLTKRQLNILNDYCNEDLSLTEIAENNKITRQAVNDIVKKGESKLLEKNNWPRKANSKHSFRAK